MSEPGFEELYARAGDDLAAVPWAALAPHPALVEWLDRLGNGGGRSALAVACGLGDDAEELRARGYPVTAFDVAPTAIAHCRRRFPDSPVDYRVADLFALPAEWEGAFDVVVEIRTLQSLPLDARPDAVRAIARAVAPGGRVFVRCFARADDEPVSSRPWPVSRRELEEFVAAGLREVDFREEPGPAFTAVYEARR